MTTVLVTGAAGYVGRHVVTALLERGVAVRAVVRPGSRSDVDPRADVVALDVLAPDADLDALLPDPVDAVVHLAWQDGFNHQAPSHVARLSDHYRLLTALVDRGVPRVAILGTMHEVGYWEGAIDEHTPTDPRSLYGVAKDALRRATLLGLADRAEVQWLRCFYITGDDRRNQSIFTRLLEAADRGQREFPFTSGVNRYDFIDVADLGRQIAVVVTTPGVTGVVNCCSGDPRSLGEMVEDFIARHDLGITLQYGAFPDRPYDSPGVWGDATRIHEILAADAR
ncbi:NAD-dependent epimerase/dehydratase family protein [Lapillicoccus jejuensis]|uniref:dTDP-6-deoxy-L-talose 4-dehydrogenase (NAD+) n=1 Tax=Lapillicoccus jejuensis TaxID=402171 RepID=A0A542DW44_9MICO|nr:NAD(P)-dependent oxidoreductase [Lapillicoccus jejuensis]TQJ07320.1 dTDP-6-deoxy-L-talose 4-dehydrogenase (NAD+) [Lapillicoccus jejuensis]